MGQRGPAPKPTRLKILHGDQNIPKGEPIPGKGEVKPPAWLKGAALQNWRRLAPDLISKQVMTHWDPDLFARFCWLEVQTRQLMAEVDEHGPLLDSRDRGKVKNPACQLLRDMTAEMLAISARFGLTPVDRTRLAKPKEPSGAQDAARYLS